jgi:DNA helicase HerA-like ATPase
MSAEHRHRLEASIPALGSSIDGRRFSFQVSLHGLELQPGGYVSLGSSRLGHVHTLEHAWVEAGALDPGLGGASAGATLRVGVAQGEGAVLEGSGKPFHDELVSPATAEAVAEWIAGTRPSRAALDVGELTLEPGVRFTLDAGGFNRHTFFCGQSGSGKTYALGTVLERLLLETTLRIVVLDPNSDFVRLGRGRPDVEPALANRYAHAVAGLVVRQAGDGPGRLHVRFVDCDASEQAAVLRLDPIRDRDEYGALVELLEAGISTPGDGAAVGLMQALLASSDPRQHALGARMRNLGVHRWRVWSSGDEDSVQDLAAPGGPRCLVVDLGSLGTPGEQAIAAESVLAALWRRREEREPVLIVIDEAHNVCPREPGDEVTALATEHAARIAAEGRKFGLYLLVSTQRPLRVNELVVSQCDNLVLMRMNAAGDLAYIADVLSFAPRPLLERSTAFRQGESLVAGTISSHPAFVRFGPRLAEEGGSDVPATWASR